MSDVFEMPVSGIPAQLKIKGSSQTLEFDDLASVQLIKKNKFVPTNVASTNTRGGWYNSNDCGFLFDHITEFGDTSGAFKLRSKVNDTYTDIFTIDNDNLLTFNSEVSFSALNLPKLGIGVNPSVAGRVQFAATTMVNKLSLYNAGVDDYNQSGFGYNSLGTLYHAPSFTSHTFYLGDSSTTPLRVNALGIHVYEGKAINSDPRRIMFYEEGENQHQVYNIGIKLLSGSDYSLHHQMSSFNGGCTWGVGLSNSLSSDVMTLRGDTTSKTLKLVMQNPLAATGGSPSYLNFDLLNSTNGGARLLHTSSSTDLVGLGTLKAQLINSSGVGTDLWIGSISAGTGIQDVTFPGTATFNGYVTIQNSSLFAMSGNLSSWQAITLNNSHASANTFIRITNTGPKLDIGNDKSVSQSYINSVDPFLLKFNGTTSVYIDSATGNIGVGGFTTPHALLQFPNATASSKIRLYEVANNINQIYSMGVETSVFRFQIPASTTDSYVFYAGLTSSTSLEVARILGTGAIRTQRYLGNGNALTAAAGSAAGTGSTITITGNEVSGTITVICGSSPSGTSVATLTLASAMPTANWRPTITSGSSSTSIINAGYCDPVNITTTTCVLSCNTALTPSSTYKWNYHILGG